MPPLAWLVFFAIYLTLLVLDLSVLHRESEVVSVSAAIRWTLIWIVVALAFAAFVYGLYSYHWFGHSSASSGKDALLQFVTGYVLEWMLSIDNIFVIAVIFAYMKIPLQYQYRVLFWGIVGAIVLRGAMIAGGAALIHTFDWTFYAFGVVLLLSAVRMLSSNTQEFDPQRSVLMRLARSIYPVSDTLDGRRFFTRINARRAATPLFVTLLFVDFADGVFAIDSIPAIFAVTQDSFLVFTSNAFAILGLRSLYFAVAGLMALFKYLKYSLIVILGLVGTKMLLHLHVQISNVMSLLIIVSVLGMGVLASIGSVRCSTRAPAKSLDKSQQGK